MPSVTGKQHRAMEAAKAGNSTLGIPKSVGADFVRADKKSGKKYSTAGMARAMATKKTGPECATCGGDHATNEHRKETPTSGIEGGGL